MLIAFTAIWSIDQFLRDERKETEDLANEGSTNQWTFNIPWLELLLGFFPQCFPNPMDLIKWKIFIS